MICPCCNKKIIGFPALSRYSNIEICSDCGVEEALQNFLEK